MMEMKPTPTPTPAPPTSASRLLPSLSYLRAIFRGATLIDTSNNNGTRLHASGPRRERGPHIGNPKRDEGGGGGVNGPNSWWGDPRGEAHISRDHEEEEEEEERQEAHISRERAMKEEPTYEVSVGGGMSERRYSRTRCLFTVVCCALAVMATLALAATFAIRAATSTSTSTSSGATSSSSSSSSSPSRDHTGDASSAIRSACNATAYPDLCYDWLISGSAHPLVSAADPVHLAATTIRLALALLQQLAPTLASVIGSSNNSANQSAPSSSAASPLSIRPNLQAFHDCLELMDLSTDQLNTSVYNLEKLSLTSLRSSLIEVKSQLSGTMGFQLACKEGLTGLLAVSSSSNLEASEESSGGGDVSELAAAAANLREDSQLNQVSKAVAIALGLVDAVSSAAGPRAVGRRLYGPVGRAHRSRPLVWTGGDARFFPDWLPGPDRRWLQSWPSDADNDGHRRSKGDANLVVAKDGSGDYGTIQEALDNVPYTNDHGSSSSSSSSSSNRFTIYIKKGVYREYVVVPKSMAGLTLVGDGIGETIITGSRSNGNGYTTYDSATVAICGPNFIARKITFRNTAGPSGHQAVALRVSSDLSVFDSCSFEGYQDTLYALANRQFYTSCIISGTVDFIFGNAIAVFQRCKISGRRPMPKQKNTFTAQGRSVAADPSGFSFHLCTLEADEELSSTPFPVKSYFGRPWRAYSRTVWMQCSVSDVIDTPGWLPWDPSNPYTDTVYYGEYGNNGVGAGTSGRVTWEGVHPTMSMEEADDFTVQNFIAGSSWLPATHVNFQASLSS